MALHWQWADKCGEATVRWEYDGEERTVNLYEGNAFLIFVNEFEENGKNMYNVWNFFADEAHAKRCLGLDKNYPGNIFAPSPIVKIRLNKTKYRKVNKLVPMLIKAFDNITIETYTED